MIINAVSIGVLGNGVKLIVVFIWQIRRTRWTIPFGPRRHQSVRSLTYFVMLCR